MPRFKFLSYSHSCIGMIERIHVLDRFHIMSYFSKAIDEVRADEARKLKQEGFEPVLKGSRWCWLKRPENLSSKQEATLSDLVQMNLKTVKSYLLKEDFQNLWEYKYAGSAADIQKRS